MYGKHENWLVKQKNLKKVAVLLVVASIWIEEQFNL